MNGFSQSRFRGKNLNRKVEGDKAVILDSLLGECLRHHYYDDAEVSQTWLVEARKAVTP